MLLRTMPHIKFLSFSFSIILLLTEVIICSHERIYEVKVAKRINEVPSRNGRIGSRFVSNTDEILEEERVCMCTEGVEAVQRIVRDMNFQFLDDHQKPDATKAYIFMLEKLINLKLLIHVSKGQEIQVTERILLPAFKCPTIPALYIYANKELNERDGNKLTAIFKDRQSPPILAECITGFIMNFAEVTREAFSDEIQVQYIENSAFDISELSDEQRFLMCRKGLDMIRDLYDEVSLNNSPPERSKFYYIKDSLEQMQVSNFKNSSTIEEGNEGSVEAFRCPSKPEIYIHVSDEGKYDKSLCVILKGNGSFALNVTAYQLKLVSDFVEVSSEDALFERKSVVNFDELDQDTLHHTCQKAIELFFGRHVTLVENTKIGLSEFYKIVPRDKDIDGSIQAIRCPTGESSVPVFLHASLRENYGNIMWVFAKKISGIERLSTWYEI